MSKYFKLFLISIITLFFAYLAVFSSFNIVNATTDIDPSQYEEYLNSIVSRDDYNDIINDSFPDFNISPDEFNERVLQNSNYKILEITPSIYKDDDSNISEINNSLDRIKQIYQNIISENDISSPGFITNMPNFKLDTMTIKQFIADRSDLSGKYDAIIFVPGNYTSTETNACDICDDKI